MTWFLEHSGNKTKLQFTCWGPTLAFFDKVAVEKVDQKAEIRLLESFWVNRAQKSQLQLTSWPRCGPFLHTLQLKNMFVAAPRVGRSNLGSIWHTKVNRNWLADSDEDSVQAAKASPAPVECFYTRSMCPGVSGLDWFNLLCYTNFWAES